MANKTTGSTSSHNHFIDIHEAVSSKQLEEKNTKIPRTFEKQLDQVIKIHSMRKPPSSNGSFSRQVSLETGFSALDRDSKKKNDRKLLSRNGLSFGGFGARNDMEGRKGDFSIFRTKSSIGKQNPMMPITNENETDIHKPDDSGGRDQNSVNKSVPAGRYFAALRGPELDQVKDCEDILLPTDEKWPFLLRFPINCFGICLGLSSQAILWRSLAQSPATQFLHVTPMINFVLWHLALSVLLCISLTYVLKCVFYLEAVRREYFHPVRVNFFFAPWIVCMFLAIGAPPKLSPRPLHPAIWCTFMTPVLILELKIYGQWLSGGKRRLCKVANPSTHLSVVGNFVGAILATKVGWLEPAKFLWAVGFAHYLVLFVTLYQRLPTNEALPKELHPVYSMFIAAPSAASIAWGNIYVEYDGVARTCYFIALFLYVSLVVRINFFRGFKFSVAWWAYTFPMTTISTATILYAEHVPGIQTKVLALTLSFMSSTMVAVLFVSTLLHAFVWQTLFPNDLAIAITKRRNSNGRSFDRDKKSFKEGNIPPRKKQSPFSFVSSSANNNTKGKDDEEKV